MSALIDTLANSNAAAQLSLLSVWHTSAISSLCCKTCLSHDIKHARKCNVLSWIVCCMPMVKNHPDSLMPERQAHMY